MDHASCFAYVKDVLMLRAPAIWGIIQPAAP
jgi:hypothetical protein